MSISTTSTAEQRRAWADKFWSRVQKPDDGCWLWLGSKIPRGYGLFYPAFKVRIYAHRFAWELGHDRSVPEDMHVMHSCDNPSCVRPDHLSIGTPSENMRDCVRKNRNGGVAPKGSKHHNAKLTESVVVELRAAVRAGKSISLLAQGLNVTETAVSFAVYGRTWKHVPGAISARRAERH